MSKGWKISITAVAAAAAAVLALALPALTGATSATGSGIIRQEAARLSFPVISSETTASNTEAANTPEPLGQIKFFVEEGERVKRGQKLAAIDSNIYRLAVSKDKAAAKGTKAQLTAAENRLAELSDRKGRLATDIRKIEGEQKKLDAKKAKVQDQLAKLERTSTSTPLKKTKLTGSLAALNAKSAALSSSLAAMAQSTGTITDTESRLEQAKINAGLQVKVAKQAVVRAQKRQKQAVLLAPRSGRIVKLSATPGELIYPDQIVIELGENQFDLKLYLDPAIARKTKPGMSARVFVDAYPGRALNATVDRLVPIVEPAPSNLASVEPRLFDVQAIILSVKDRDGILKAGLPADAVIDYR